MDLKMYKLQGRAFPPAIDASEEAERRAGTSPLLN